MLVLGSDYSVTLNPDQDISPGGTITYPITGSPLASGEKLTLLGDVDYDQTTDLLGGGAFNARVIEDTFDRVVIQIQQLDERVDRALIMSVGTTVSGQLPDAATRANKLLSFDSSGNPIVTAPSAGTATALANDLAATGAGKGATMVGFIQAGTGAVNQTVEDKLRRLQITPYDFDCVAGTAADQTAKMQNAINRAATSGQPLDLCGQTWRIDGQLNLASNLEIRNGTLDASFAISGTKLMVGTGTLGSGTSFTAASRGAGTFTVSSATGLANLDWLYLRSTDAFGSGGTHRGEWVRISSIATLTITPYGRLMDTYTTTPQYFKPTLIENITLRNLRLRGRGNTFNQYAAQFLYARNVRIEDVTSEFFGDRHVEFQRCFDCYVTNSTMAHCDTASGLAYGVAIVNGCACITVTGCTFRDMRHGVTVGANDGVDRSITVTGCVALDCTDAGFDTHPQSHYVVFSGNTVNGQGTAAGGSGDGIVMQGANMVAIGNTVMGFTRAGIFIQNLVTNSAMTDDNAVVSGNSVSFPTGSGPIYGIAMENQRTVNGWRFSVTGNTVDTTNVTNSNGIWCEIVSGGSTNSSVSITGNQVYARRNCLTLQTATLKFIRTVAVTGNTFESLDTATYDNILVNSVTANYIERAIISGNSLHGGRYGVNNVQGSRVKVDANVIQAFGTAATNGTISGTNDNLIT